jgi:hypothetical protein
MAGLLAGRSRIPGATQGLLERVECQKEHAAGAVLDADTPDTFALWNSKVKELATQAEAGR